MTLLLQFSPPWTRVRADMIGTYLQKFHKHCLYIWCTTWILLIQFSMVRSKFNISLHNELYGHLGAAVYVVPHAVQLSFQQKLVSLPTDTMRYAYSATYTSRYRYRHEYFWLLCRAAGGGGAASMLKLGTALCVCAGWAGVCFTVSLVLSPMHAFHIVDHHTVHGSRACRLTCASGLWSCCVMQCYLFTAAQPVVNARNIAEAFTH